MFNLLSRLFDSDGNANPTLPALPPLIVKNGEQQNNSALVEVMDQPLTSKEWLLFIRKALLYLKESNPPEETRLYLTERAVLPGNNSRGFPLSIKFASIFRFSNFFY